MPVTPELRDFYVSIDLARVNSPVLMLTGTPSSGFRIRQAVAGKVIDVSCVPQAPRRPVVPVVVGVSGARRLTLITDCADYSIKQGYVFWGSARLVKK